MRRFSVTESGTRSATHALPDQQPLEVNFADNEKSMQVSFKPSKPLRIGWGGRDDSSLEAELQNLGGPTAFDVDLGDREVATVLPDAVVNQLYTQTMQVSGATAPVTYLLMSGTLQTGLIFSSSGTISGTPLITGQETLVIRAIDATNDTATATFSLTVGTKSSNTGSGGGGGGGGGGGCSIPPGGPALVLAILPTIWALRRRR